ncbi:MAG: FAD-dependent oxidoreductase, partial [Chloroflexi bacterium]|nr:FAD-dependent oxidoreductase [Chloroflexota bacterium]
AVVLAPGYSLFDARRAEELGYGRYPNVVTSMEYERLLSASGPTGGHITRPSDHEEPQKIAFLQCVGSRDQEHDYCSSVCCMYATKEAMLTLEHVPGVHCQVYQMDMRAFGKGFDAYYRRAQEQGIGYTRSRASRLVEDPKTKDIIIRYQDEETGDLHEETYGLVVLSVGFEPPADSVTMSQSLGIDLNDLGFCWRAPGNPVETSRPGVYVCGAFAEPKDIPDSVVEASGAAAGALRVIGTARGTLVTAKEYPPETDVDAAEPRVGVFICSCGSNIAGVVDVADVTAYAATLPGVVHAENTMYTCSADSLKLIQERVQEHNLNRVVVSSCTPRTHEPLFQDTIRSAGLNPYLFEMANIRDQCSWVHSKEPEFATAKSEALTRMAVARARTLEPLHKEKQPLDHSALVIGGGVAGMTAALSLADQGYQVVLVEREPALGGRLRSIHYTTDGLDPQAYLQTLIDQVQANERIEVLLGHRLVKYSGYVGNFQATVASTSDPTQRLIPHGVAIVATGGQEYRPQAYGPGVITQGDLEARLAAGDAPHRTVMIQCAGPWDDDANVDFYCSRVCCTVAVKNALKIKELRPDAEVFVLYRDMRTYGFKEALYTEARRQGVVFVRWDDEHRPQVKTVDGRLQVQVRELNLGQDLVIKPDVVALSSALVPGEGSQKLAELMKFSCAKEGFFLEAHVKLRPVDFPSEGIFLCGVAHYPKFVDETVAQAQAAAARAATILSQDMLDVGGVVAVVEPEKCTACLTCVRVCPFDVPVIDHEMVGAGGIVGAAVIRAAACQGCGICVGECPAKAIQLQHYRDDQIICKTEALLVPA